MTRTLQLLDDRGLALHEFSIGAEVLFGSQQLIQQQGHVHRGDPELGDSGQQADYVRAVGR